MNRQESQDGNLPAGNVHELPVIYLKTDHMLDCMVLPSPPPSRLIPSTVFSSHATNVGNRLRGNAAGSLTN